MHRECLNRHFSFLLYKKLLALTVNLKYLQILFVVDQLLSCRYYTVLITSDQAVKEEEGGGRNQASVVKVAFICITYSSSELR